MSTTQTSIPKYTLEDANPHYLQRVVSLSDSNPVLTREDVFDTRGFKLLSKGALVDDSVYERLLRFRLSKPIESVLGIEDGITVSELTCLAEELMAANDGMAQMLATMNADKVAVNLVKQLKLEGSSSLMLSLHREESSKLRHGMMVALLAAGIGHQAGLRDFELSALVAAGVMHDLGELYIDPKIFGKAQSLSPSEWKHIACHPLIGEVVIRETMSFPGETSRFVAEHHERVNGYGYPRLLRGPALSLGGSCLAAAEVVAGIMGREEADVDRIGCALKMIQGEFPKVTVSLIDRTYRVLRDELGISSSLLQGKPISSRADELGASLASAIGWAQSEVVSSNCSGVIHQFVLNRLYELRKAAFSTGIISSASGGFSDIELSRQETLELQSVCLEIQFRLKEISYLASLHPEANVEENQAFVSVLAEKLLASDGNTSLH